MAQETARLFLFRTQLQLIVAPRAIYDNITVTFWGDGDSN